MNETKVWWRHRWTEAVFSSDLKPLEKFVAVIYADHAGAGRTAWVKLDRLMERTSLSRDAANRAVKGLEKGGWLVAMVRVPRRPVEYALVVPEGAGSP